MNFLVGGKKGGTVPCIGNYMENNGIYNGLFLQLNTCSTRTVSMKFLAYILGIILILYTWENRKYIF